MAEDQNQPKSPTNSSAGVDERTAAPKRGAKITEPLTESVSGLDVRQLLGLGRTQAEPASVKEPAPIAEPVEIERPIPNAPPRSPAQSRAERVVVDDPVLEFSDNEVSAPPVARQVPPEPTKVEVPRPTSPPQRPPRPAFDALDVKTAGEIKTPEPITDPSANTGQDANFHDTAGSISRPIPPVTDPSELPSLRPSIDPIAANASLSAARPGGEEVPGQSKPVAIDPSVAANAKLQELASLSERTLEDYETFDDFDDAAPQRSKKTPIIILASLLSIGVLAGGVVFAYRQGVKESTQTTLPIIKAETSATKEEPRNPGGVTIPNQNKLIYDRILGEETDIAEKIVPREEKVAQLNQKPGFTTLSKTLPPAKTVVPPVPGAPAKPVENAVPTPASGIKKVVQDQVAKKLLEVSPPKPISPPDSLISTRGVVPKLIVPESSIVPEVSQPQTETLDLPPKIQEINPVGQNGEIVRLETETVNQQPDVPATPAPAATTEPSQEKLAIIKQIEESVGATEQPALKPKLPPVLPRRKPPAPSAQATRVASATVPATRTASTTARATTGGFVIQIAAFRSQEEALTRYASLKRRHSSLLRPYTSFIQRADLGDRGVYYRLRLGPIDGKDKASQLCRSLLSAGEKDCLVRTR